MIQENDFKVEKSKCFTFRFKLYFLVSVVYVLSLAIFICISEEKANTKVFEISISLTLIIFTFAQFEIQHKKNEIKTFREYNNRYDKINDDLNFLIDKDKIKTFEEEQIKHSNKKTAKGLIIDYLVLCSEEYYWRKQGYISKELWINWQRGIEEKFTDFQKVEGIYEIIRYEYDKYKKSYYGFFESEFLKQYLDGSIIGK